MSIVPYKEFFHGVLWTVPRMLMESLASHHDSLPLLSVDVTKNLSLLLVFSVESNIFTTVLFWYPLITMKFLGILRACALFILVSAFYGTNCQDMNEKLMQEIAEQRTELVERLSKSDAPYTLEDMYLFLNTLRDEADVNPEAVQKVGQKIHTFLGNLGIHGADAKESLEILVEMIQEYVMGLFSSTKQLSNEERAAMRKTVAAILEQLPKSHVNTEA